MPTLGNNDVERVREATDLVRLIGENVALRPKGREHVGLCPFHADRTPSMAVVTHKGSAFYKCHACGAGGDALDFVQQYHKMSFVEALKYLADRAGIELTRRREPEQAHGISRTDVRRANEYAARFYQRILHDDARGETAREVIRTRRISPAMVDAFLLGAAPDEWDALRTRIVERQLPVEAFASAGLLKPGKTSGSTYDAFRNRLMFPICDELGKVIAFGARKIRPEDEPKYLNSAESALFHKSRTLYGLHLAKRSIIEQSTAIITEGYTDVIACHEAGVTNAVGTLGTALTQDHARMLERLCERVVLVFDGDAAGQRAASRALEILFAFPIDVRICVLPDEFDPDELLREPGGVERFRAAVAGATDAIDFWAARFRAQSRAAATPAARERVLNAFLAELANLGFNALPGVRRHLLLGRLAECFGMPAEQIDRAMPKTRPSPRSADTSNENSPRDDASRIEVDGAGVSRARRLAERELLAVAIYDPSTLAMPIEAEPGAMTIGELLDPTTFVVPVHAAITNALRSLMAGEREMNVPALLETIDQLGGEVLDEATARRARALAGAMFFEARDRCGDNQERALLLARESAVALQRVRSLEAYAASSPTPGESQTAASAFELIRARSKQGAIASAISRRARVETPHGGHP